MFIGGMKTIFTNSTTMSDAGAAMPPRWGLELVGDVVCYKHVAPLALAASNAQRASLAELDALFATLQHRAFRGET